MAVDKDIQDESNMIKKHEDNFVCVECGVKSDEIYKEFKGGSFKLCICVSVLCTHNYLRLLKPEDQ